MCVLFCRSKDLADNSATSGRLITFKIQMAKKSSSVSFYVLFHLFFLLFYFTFPRLTHAVFQGVKIGIVHVFSV